MNEVVITLGGHTFEYSISFGDERKYLDAMKNTAPISDEAICEIIADMWVGQLVEAARLVDENAAVDAAKLTVVPITITPVP